MNLIDLKNVTKVYGCNDYAVTALKNVTLSVEKGEFISIMGPSGSGKSTLLNIIGCMDIPSEGEYFLKGKRISVMKDRELSKTRNETLSFIFQNFALMQNYSVYENVALPLFKKDMSKAKKVEKVRFYLKKLGIEDLIKKDVSKLSGGQKQRVAIARALTSETDIILADEPTGALDQKNGFELMDILCNLNNEGKTIIAITHDEKIAAYSKRKLSILDGELFEERSELCEK